MTLADFLRSGNLKDLLHEQNILEESWPEGIINYLLPFALLPEDEQAIITTMFKTEKEKFERAMQLWRMVKLKENKSLSLTLSGTRLNPNIEFKYPGIEIHTNKVMGYAIGYYFELLRLNNLPELADAVSAFFCLLEYLAENLRQKTRLREESDYKDYNTTELVKYTLRQSTVVSTRQLKDGYTGYSVEYTDIPYDPNSWGTFRVKAVSGLVLLSVTGYLLYKFLMLVKTAMIKSRQIGEQKLLLSRASGPNQGDPISSLAELANDVLSLASENAELESKKKAQAQKINEKIEKLNGKDDDEELVEMVRKYVNQFYKGKVSEFEAQEENHRIFVDQDEHRHNKTKLNFVSTFFQGLEVNDFF